MNSCRELTQRKFIMILGTDTSTVQQTNILTKTSTWPLQKPAEEYAAPVHRIRIYLRRKGDMTSPFNDLKNRFFWREPDQWQETRR
jgi:hypothetical protein